MNQKFKNIPSPSFVLDEQLLINNLEKLHQFKKEAGISIICALKGFSFHNQFKKVLQHIDGATASSLHEARLVYEEMQTKAHTYCAVFVPNEFDEICKYSSHLSFNSLSQWETYKDKIPANISCGLRVNPRYSEIETELYNPSSPNSRLGIAHHLLENKLPNGIEGLHIHAMCENNSFTLERLLDAFSAKYDAFIKQIKWLNLGGGHLITHKDYDIEHGIKVFQNFKAKYPNLEKIIIEPGSAIGWQTGYLVSTVLDIVQNSQIPTAMLDVSFTCHMPDCLEMPYQPKIIGTNETGSFEYNMGGMSCLAGDVMGTWKFDEPLKIGDKVVFDDMIHYTMVKTSTFNGINLPNIGVLKTDGKFDLVQTFGFEDYKKRLS